VLVHNCRYAAKVTSAASAATCAATLAACGAEVIGTVGVAAASGVGGVALLPAAIAGTGTTCGAAVASCAATAGSAVVQNAYSRGQSSGKNDSGSGSGGLLQPKSTQDMFIPRDEKGRVVPLPRDKHGVPVPQSNVEHTQIGGRAGRKGDYRQTRQWNTNGKEVKTTDWTDHGRGHPNPHDHFVEPNATGGTHQRGDGVPSTVTVSKK
jgi:hypothetical protein